MTEQEKLHHAKHYIDSLANGLNPLDGTPIPEQDIVNNVKISRCLFFVSDVLRKQLDGHEPKKVSEKDKKLFYITEEEKLQYVPSKTPIPASGISYKVNEILDEKKMRKVSYRTITTWLVKVGLMEEEDISDLFICCNIPCLHSRSSYRRSRSRSCDPFGFSEQPIPHRPLLPKR